MDGGSGCWVGFSAVLESYAQIFAKRLFLPPALLANTHLLFINSALPPSWEQKIALFAHGLQIVQTLLVDE